MFLLALLLFPVLCHFQLNLILTNTTRQKAKSIEGLKMKPGTSPAPARAAL